MANVPLQYSLGLSALLFAIGMAGVIVRRNAIILFMCIELMLNAVNLAFVALAPHAAEAAVGLAIIISVFRHSESVDIKHFSLLRW
jgi:NADH-quinone oxidoreductase subunit K